MNKAIYTSQRGYWNWPKSIRGLVSSRHGARYGELIVVGGQCALDEHGKILAPEDAVAQAEIAMAYVNGVIDDLGDKNVHLVKLTVFYVYGGDELEVAILKRIRKCIKGSPAPSLSMVPLPRLALTGLKVTIDAVAICPEDGTAPRASASSGNWPWPKDAEFSHGIRCGKWAFVSAQMATRLTRSYATCRPDCRSGQGDD